MDTTTNLATAIESRPDHAHHWKIAEASGPFSDGVCRVCGARKPFRNWLPDTDFITNEEHRLAA
jgi:hypothetical protein